MIGHKKHWEVTAEEVADFYNSLKKERETFKLNFMELLKSEIIIKEEASGKIAGIAGIRKHKMLPVLFIVVKSEFQGKNLGKKLLERLHRTTKGKYNFIVLSVAKKNKSALELFKKFEYEVFYQNEEFYYMICLYNNKLKFLHKIHRIFKNLLFDKSQHNRF